MIIIDCEKMKYPNTGLFFFLRYACESDYRRKSWGEKVRILRPGQV